MTAADLYLAALREAAGITPKPIPKKPAPKKLEGGCLLYRLAPPKAGQKRG